MKWKEIKSEKDLPSKIHFENNTEYWASAKGIVFKIYFYNSYGGKNYSLSDHGNTKLRRTMLKNKIPFMGLAEDLDAYGIIDTPKPFLK